MKKFNKTIQIEVEADQIAHMLLANMKEDAPHREIITETIIGTSINSNTLSLLYNNLCGYTNDIDFTVGQRVICSKEIYYDGQRHPIGAAVIVDIDIHQTSNKVLVEFKKSSEDTRTSKEWVSHHTLTNATEEVVND